jgi:hypothetical protein
MIETFGREEFLTNRWSYKPGEHVTFIAPTQSGKTYLAYQLLGYTATPKCPAIVLSMKPRDGTTEKFTKELGFRRVPVWPPGPSIQWTKKPPGYTLWPPAIQDPEADDANLKTQFQAAIRESYHKGNRIIYGDELYGLSDIGLDRDMIRVWSRGASLGCAVWGSTQKPSHIPLWAYNQADHLFIAYDPDKENRKRYDEIGGIDPGIVRDLVLQLDKERFQFLYLRRKGPRYCIVDGA